MSDPVVLDDEMQIDEANNTIDESAIDDEVGVDEEIDELADDDELDDVALSTVGGADDNAKEGAASGSNAANADEPGGTAKAPSAKKPPRKPATERTPGSSLLPVSRVTKIMKADKDLGITAKEAVFLISIATEEFIKRLALDGHKQATREGRSVITQKDLAAAVRRSDELLFLKEIVPLPIPLAQAMVKRQAKADGADIEEVSNPITLPAPSSSKNGTTSAPASVPFAPAPAGALDAFIDRKPNLRKARPSRGATTNSSAMPEGLVNGQHTFPAIDPTILERERHPSYYGDFTLPIAPTPIPTSATTTPTPAPRTSGRQSIPTARRAAQAQAQAPAPDAMDTT